jgi:uncharacterized cupin superfamily protein
MRSFLLSGVLFAIGCSASAEPFREVASPVRGSAGFVVYKHGETVNVTTIIQPADIGATGNVALKQRIDYQDVDWSNPRQHNVVRMGVRESSTGTLTITYPWDEHATVITGQLTLAYGQNQETLQEGDSYLVAKGTPITWTANQTTQISFGNRKGPVGTFSGLKVMHAGVEVTSGLVPLPPPEALGGKVLNGGSVQLFGVIDFVADVDAAQRAHAMGSVFEATKGDIDIHVPFTEYVGILWNHVQIGLSNKATFMLDPGDSAFVIQDTNILWSVSDPNVQESFLARTGIECHVDSDCQLAQDWITCGCMGLPAGVNIPNNSCPDNVVSVCGGQSAVCDTNRQACIAGSAVQ